MKTFTIVEKIPCRSRSKAARYFLLRNRYLAKRIGQKPMTQTAIANRLKISVACVNEQAKALGLVASR